MTGPKFSILPITVTLVGVALEVGNYESRYFANLVWGACVLLWAGWGLYLLAPGSLSGDDKRFRERFAQYRRLLELQAEGKYLLTEIAWLDYLGAGGDANAAANKWITSVHAYMQREFSEAEARWFTHPHTVNEHPEIGIAVKYSSPDQDVLAAVRRVYGRLQRLDEKLASYGDITDKVTVGSRRAPPAA